MPILVANNCCQIRYLSRKQALAVSLLYKLRGTMWGRFVGVPQGRLIVSCCLTEVEVEVMNKKTNKKTKQYKDADQKKGRRALALTLRSDRGQNKAMSPWAKGCDFAEAAKPRAIQIFQTGIERMRSTGKQKKGKPSSPNKKRTEQQGLLKHFRRLKTTSRKSSGKSRGNSNKNGAVAMSGSLTKGQRFGICVVVAFAVSVGLGGTYLNKVHNWQQQHFLSWQSWRQVGPATLQHIKSLKDAQLLTFDKWSVRSSKMSDRSKSHAYRHKKKSRSPGQSDKIKFDRTKRLESPGVARRIKAKQQRRWKQKVSQLEQRGKKNYRKVSRHYRHPKVN